MRAYGKKAAVIASVATLAVGCLTGCSGNVDGSKTAAVVNGDEIKVGTLSLATRYQQAQTTQMYEMYFGGMQAGVWDTVADEETGETYGEQTVNEVLEQLENMVLLRQHAEEYEVTISDDQKTQLQDAAKTFMEANDETTIARLGVSQELVEEYLELTTYNSLMYDPMTADVDTEVDDDEAAQTGITYVSVSAASDADSGEETEDGTEVETQDDVMAKAQLILEQVKSTEDADMNSIAQTVDESLSATTTTYSTNPPETTDEDTEEASVEDDGIPQEVKDAVKDLKDGEVYDQLVEVEGTYYVVRLDAAFDEDATEEQKETIVNERKQTAYDDIIEGWRKDSEITVEDKAVKTVRVRDNDKYTLKTEEAEDTEGESVDSGLTVDSGEAVDSGTTEDTEGTEDAAAEETDAALDESTEATE